MRYEKQPWNRITATTEIVVAGVPITGHTVQCAIKRKSDGHYLANGGGSWAAGYAQNVMAEVDAGNIPGLYEFAAAASDLAQGEVEYWIEVKAAATGAMPNPLLEFVHVVPDLTGQVTDLADAVINTEGITTPARGAHHTATALHAGGTKFYSTTLATFVAEPARVNGRLAVFRQAASTARELVRITNAANDGTDHFVVQRLDGSAIPAPGVAVGDELFVLHANDLTGDEIADEVLDEPMSGHAVGGTLGDDMRRMLSLRQNNVRIVNATWSANGQPATGSIYIYDSAADLTTDTGPGWALATGRYDFTATYDGSGRLTDYISARVL